MKILLINQNATVEKLVRLSALKVGLELETVSLLDDATSSGYAWVLVDHDSLAGTTADDLKAKFAGTKVGFLYPKGEDKLDGFDMYIEKPFLPTELIDEFSLQMGTSSLDEETPSFDDGLSLDDDLSLDSELPSLDDDLSLDDMGAGVSLPELDSADDLDLGGLDELGSLEEASSEDVSLEETPVAESTAEEISLDDDLATLDMDLEEASIEEELPSVADQAEASEELDLGELEDMGALEEESAELEDLNLESDLSEDALEEVSFEESLPEEAVAAEDLEDLNLEEQIETKTEILDEEEVENIKELLEDDEDVKIDLGENSALLDEDDLADLHKGSTIDDEEIDSAFGELEELASSGDDDLSDLSEESVADALGEELPASEDFSFEETSDSSFDELDESGDFEESFEEIAEPVTAPAVADPKQIVENTIGSLSTATLKELLDGMQLTINISFPNKK